MQNKEFKLNLPQAMVTQAKQKHIYLECGRGLGKSTILAYRIKTLCEALPRAKFVLVGETYKQILTRTLPSTVKALELLGWYQGVHFFIGKKAPNNFNWNYSYEAPLSFEYFICTYTGAGIELVSLDKNNDGRGLNSDGSLGDEAALFDYDKLFASVLATQRGNVDLFSNQPLHLSNFYCSTTPLSTTGKWLFKKEEEAIENPNNIAYIRAASQFNSHNLPKDYFITNKRALTPLIFDAEILNIRPGRAATGFYPNFGDHNKYQEEYDQDYLLSFEYDLNELSRIACKKDGDCISNKPLDISFDWGGKINTLVVGQDYYNPYKSRDEYRLINEFFLKSPNTVINVTEEFCKYYEKHECKELNFYYDHTAIPTDAVRSTTYKDEVTRVLERNGWTVNDLYIGQASSHHARYIFFAIMHNNNDNRLPALTYNKTHCKYLIMSIENAGAIQKEKGIGKDKREEQKKNAIDEETTHFSDAHDTLVYSKFHSRLDNVGYFV